MRYVDRSLLLLALCGACSSGSPTAGLQTVSDDPVDLPLLGASADQLSRFRHDDAVFDVVYREPDGLGPLYIRAACSSCHGSAGKGPGAVQKMALVEADDVTPGDQSGLTWGPTVRPYATGGATPITPPSGSALTGGLRAKLSLRVGVALFGRGYIEAVDDAEIERVEAEQATRSDGISGRINRVTYASEANPTPFHDHARGETNLIGRFGLKARVATLDDFAADAAQGDMGMTSPMRPSELPNPDMRSDDAHPGVDLDLATINSLADYMRMLEIPTRPAADARGAALFVSTQCAVCHAPSLRTRGDYPIPALAGIDAKIFSDLLLHDMGAALADGLTDQSAHATEWRTAPLIGLRHQHNYLHDGRAKTLAEAVQAHDAPDSEAFDSAQRFNALGDADRQALLDYLATL